MSFLIYFEGIQAQTTDKRIDQVELLMQFVGTWRTELGKDTIAVTEFKAYGSGLDGYVKIITKGETLMELRQLYGYDRKTDKIISAEMYKYKGSEIGLWACWFTSKNIFSIVSYDDIADPDNAALKIQIEIKSPDSYITTHFVNNEPIRHFKAYRE
jgi:hypothetical protein